MVLNVWRGDHQLNVFESPGVRMLIVVALLQLGMDFKKVRSENKIVHVETFNSTKKRAGVVFKVLAYIIGEGRAPSGGFLRYLCTLKVNPC